MLRALRSELRPRDVHPWADLGCLAAFAGARLATGYAVSARGFGVEQPGPR